MSRTPFPKPLKGIGSLGDKFLGPIQDSIISTISSGGISLTNVEITGGTIDGTVTGTGTPGPGVFTTLQTGNPSGQGYQACFYGQTVGDSACWLPVTGTWSIQGDLIVRDISDLGNLRIATNTISSTNVNGNVIIDPDGSGLIRLIGPISHTATSGNVSLNATTGNFTLNTGTTVSTVSATNTSLTATNGNISLVTGTDTSKDITFITTGSTVTVTTSSSHTFSSGDTVTVSGSNSTPVIDGTYIVIDAPTSTTFRIIPGFTVTSAGTTGSVYKNNDINLTPSNNVNIPDSKGLTFGGDAQYITSSSGELTIAASNDINLSTDGEINLNTSTNVNIPTNSNLTFGDTAVKMNYDGTNLTIFTGTGKLIVDNDILINGGSTRIESTITTIEDPVITLGSSIVDDNKDRGLEVKWNNGVDEKIAFIGRQDSTGCFTYIPDAINNSEVFSGTPGCAVFGALTATSLNLSSGSVTAGSLSVCNISCPSAFTLTAGTSATITAPTVSVNASTTTFNTDNFSVTDPIITIGSSFNDSKDRGIEFNYYDTGAKTAFFGWDSSSNCFTFLQDTTNTSEVISGTKGDMCLGNTTVQDLTVTGNVYGITTGGGLTTEHLSGNGGGSVSPTVSFNISFVSVLTSGTLNGELPVGTSDGYQKLIICSSLATGSEYTLDCPTGKLLDPGTGTTVAKKITFKTAGQSILLIWDNNLSMYTVISGNACVSLL